jgi:hypothetical protein
MVMALVAALAIAGAGCGEDEEEPTAAETTATTEQQAPPATTETKPAAAAEEREAERRERRRDRARERRRERERERRQREREQESDAEIERGREFYLRMDDLAIALDEAIDQALDGDPAGVQRISSLRARILKRVNDHLLAGGDTSVGGNLLLSAATQARESARNGNLPRLVDARRDITEARNKLAEEAIG